MAELPLSGEAEGAKPGPGGAAWRILAFLALTAVLAGAGEIAIAAIFPRLQATGALTPSSIPGVAIILAAITLATLLMLRTGAGMSWSRLGLDPSALAAPNIAVGALLGAASIGLASAVLLVAHELRIQSAGAGVWWNAAFFDFELLAPAAAVEELLMRGYIFALLRKQWGWKPALIATSIAFGLLHIFNPGATVESILAVTLAGFFLGAILLVTGSLYAVIAAHFAWNWIMSAVLHTTVSGAGLPSPNYTVVDNGPDWLTGGAWGPEGGAAACAAMLLVILYLYRRNLSRLES